MTFFALLLLTGFACIVFLQPLQDAASWYAYRQQLPFAEISDVGQWSLSLGLGLGLVALFGPYTIRRFVVALVCGFALALVLVHLLPLDPAQRWHLRTDWKHAVACFVAAAIWYGFQQPPETREVQGRQVTQLRLAFWACLSAAVGCAFMAWKESIGGELSPILLHNRPVKQAQLYGDAMLLAGSIGLLCWLALERLLESAPSPTPRPLSSLRNKAAEEWRRPSI